MCLLPQLSFFEKEEEEGNTSKNGSTASDNTQKFLATAQVYLAGPDSRTQVEKKGKRAGKKKGAKPFPLSLLLLLFLFGFTATTRRK